MQRDAHAPGAFTREGHPGGVTAEGRQVLLQPFECKQLVTETIVSCEFRGSGLGQKSQYTEPVVEADYDNVVPGRKVRAVLQVPVVAQRGVSGGAVREGATMQVNQHRQGFFAVRTGRPDIQVKAVLTQRRRQLSIVDPERIGGLGTGVSHGSRGADTVPGSYRLRVGKTQLSHRWLSVWYAQPRGNLPAFTFNSQTAEAASRCFGQWTVTGCGRTETQQYQQPGCQAPVHQPASADRR